MSKLRIRQSSNLLTESLCPFLYQTRTIQHSQHGHIVRNFASSSRHQLDLDAEHTQRQDANRMSFLQRKARAIQQKRHQGIETTITAEERRAFENIRRTFEAPATFSTQRKPRTKAPAAVLTSDLYDANYERILNLFAPKSDALSQHTHEVDSEASPPRHEQIREHALKALRHIAKALADIVLGKHSLSSTAGTPDRALWQYLENDIIPIINLLRPDLDTNASTTTTAGTPIDDPPVSTTFNASVQQRTPSDVPSSLIPPCLSSIPSDTQLLPLVTILYSSATLLLLRTYAAYFPSSPYLPSLLPYLRDLGPTSFLLAGSTPFYNTLLQASWDIYSDFESLERLTKEMRREGVESDDGTVAVIEGVLSTMKRDLSQTARNAAGTLETERAKEWWEMRGTMEAVERLRVYVDGMKKNIRRAASRKEDQPSVEASEELDGDVGIARS